MEEDNMDFQTAFVRMLGDHPILFKNSQLPEARRSKSAAIEEIQHRCAVRFGKSFTDAQISKRIMNLKSRVRMKIALKRSTGKHITLKSWERQLLAMMQVKGNDSPNTSKDADYDAASTSGLSDMGADGSEVVIPAIVDCTLGVEASPDSTPGPSSVQELETEKTQNLSLTELQRYVLLTQQRVLKTQLRYLEKKNRILDLREKALRTQGGKNTTRDGEVVCKEEPLYKDELYDC